MLRSLMSNIFTQFHESFLCFEMEKLFSIVNFLCDTETSKRNDDNMKVVKNKQWSGKVRVCCEDVKTTT